MKEFEPINRINRAANIAIAHGVWVNGIYRRHGEPQLPREKRLTVPKDAVFNMKGQIIFREVQKL